jgi:hypothetical protein
MHAYIDCALILDHAYFFGSIFFSLAVSIGSNHSRQGSSSRRGEATLRHIQSGSCDLDKILQNI